MVFEQRHAAIHALLEVVEKKADEHRALGIQLMRMQVYKRAREEQIPLVVIVGRAG